MASEAPHIDWSTAEVIDGTLSVPLAGAAAKPWRKDFERVLALLGDEGRAGWGEIALRKGHLEVSEVSEGAEADLRHLLESAVLQANTDLGAAPAETEDAEDADTPDRRMTATFRRFGLPA